MEKENISLTIEVLEPVLASKSDCNDKPQPLLIKFLQLCGDS